MYTIAAIEAMTPKRSSGPEIVNLKRSDTPKSATQNFLLCFPAAGKASLRTRIAWVKLKMSAANCARLTTTRTKPESEARGLVSDTREVY
jgi:malic enzyme